MVTCKKCKEKISIFANKSTCTDCDANYCERCAITEIVECEYCYDKYCKKCLIEHTPDCKEENESADEEDEEEIDGMSFNDDKSICILDISNNDLTNFINVLSDLRKNYIIDKDLSSDKELVWIKK